MLRAYRTPVPLSAKKLTHAPAREEKHAEQETPLHYHLPGRAHYVWTYEEISKMEIQMAFSYFFNPLIRFGVISVFCAFGSCEVC